MLLLSTFSSHLDTNFPILSYVVIKVLNLDNEIVGDINIESSNPPKRKCRTSKSQVKPKGRGKNNSEIVFSDEYVVERIINKRLNDMGEVECRIKWAEFDHDQNTWEHHCNVFCTNEIVKFENKVMNNVEKQ